jgi:drug/metabolite transporter (DMT)-like permease
MSPAAERGTLTVHRERRTPGLRRGAAIALGSAALFGASTPAAKLLVGHVNPIVLAGLFYLGSGIGLSLFRRVRRRGSVPAEAPLRGGDWAWFAAAAALGGVLAPVLLMTGLRTTPASIASLMLNLEGVFTALLAWFVFRENFDRRIFAGMLCILAGGAILSSGGAPAGGVPWSALAIAGACLAWAVDNNLTRKVSAGDPLQVASLKGLVAGSANLSLGVLAGAALPPLGLAAAAGVVGLIGYGVSLAMFVVALREIGTARTAAYFSVAPFVGTVASLVAFREPFTAALAGAGLLMGTGVWLHLSERHEHEHAHAGGEHEHRHLHDEHHRHPHAPGAPPGEPHSHTHTHEPTVHAHPHYPDIHHRHAH